MDLSSLKKEISSSFFPLLKENNSAKVLLLCNQKLSFNALYSFQCKDLFFSNCLFLINSSIFKNKSKLLFKLQKLFKCWIYLIRILDLKVAEN